MKSIKKRILVGICLIGFAGLLIIFSMALPKGVKVKLSPIHQFVTEHSPGTQQISLDCSGFPTGITVTITDITDGRIRITRKWGTIGNINIFQDYATPPIFIDLICTPFPDIVIDTTSYGVFLNVELLSGNDSFSTLHSPCIVYAGSGDDNLAGGDNNLWPWNFSASNELWGGDGNDVITGGPELDKLYGGSGNDQIFGLDGDDFMYGEDGDDTLDGGNDNDEMHGGIGKDVLYGGDGDDIIYGEAGNDTIDGGDGNNTIYQ